MVQFSLTPTSPLIYFSIFRILKKFKIQGHTSRYIYSNSRRIISHRHADIIIINTPSLQRQRLRQISRLLGTPFRLVWRILQLTIVLSPILTIVPFSLSALKLRKYFQEMKTGEFHSSLKIIDHILGIHWCLIDFCFRTAGGSLLKIGQWAATRPDLIPPDLAQKLSHLQSRVSHHSMAWNRLVFLEDIGIPLEKLFTYFDPIPIGSGSVAQVHRAILRRPSESLATVKKSDSSTYDNLNQKKRENCMDQTFSKNSASLQSKNYILKDELPPKWVAVKIRHPEIEQIISDDLLLLSLGASIFTKILPQRLRWLRLDRETSHFGQMMRSQMLLRSEKRNMNLFNWNFLHWYPVLIFPKPVDFLCTDRILVESLVVGTSVSSLMKCQSIEPNNPNKQYSSKTRETLIRIKKDIAEIGITAFLRMLLWDNFIHADLHPGNILVRLVDKKTGNLIYPSPHHSLLNTRKNISSSKFCETLMNTLKDCDEIKSDLICENPLEAIESHILKCKDGGANIEAQLIILDTGLVSQMDEQGARNFRDLFSALALRSDGLEAANLLISRTKDSSWTSEVIDYEGFAKSLNDLARSNFRGIANWRDFSLSPVLLSIVTLATRHHVHLESDFTTIVASFACIEGMGRILAPDLPILPLLARAALRRVHVGGEWR